MRGGKGERRYPGNVHRRLLFPFLALPALGKVERSISRSSFLLFILAVVTLAGLSCNKRPEPYRESGFMMGTIVDVVLFCERKTGPEAAGLAFEKIRQIEGSAHASYEGAPLALIRQGQGAHISGDLKTILETAMGVAKASSGAFDPTLGEVVHLWGFGREDYNLPDAKEIVRALKNTGYEMIPSRQCCPEGLAVWFDLGGVAKGHAVDSAVMVLRETGVNAGIVNAGGDLRTFGSHPSRGYWKIGVQDPDDPQELAGVLEVKEAAVATSGDYQRYFEKDGIRYHHILDPSTGYPAHAGLRGTTVIAPDCATADALATASFVMGPEKGLALLEAWEGAEGVLITDDGTILTTSGIGGEGVRFTKSSD